MTETIQPIPDKNTIAMYRVENPNIPATPDGVVSHGEIVGQWFSPDLESVLRFLRKSSRRNGKIIDGTQLVIAHVPKEDVEKFHVSKHIVASEMDVEPDNYIIPRDGVVPMDMIPLDETLGELKGNLAIVRNSMEAKQRVMALVGVTAVK